MPTNTAIHGRREARKAHAGRTELSYVFPFPSQNWHTSMEDAPATQQLGIPDTGRVRGRGSPPDRRLPTPVVSFTSAWAQGMCQIPGMLTYDWIKTGASSPYGTS